MSLVQRSRGLARNLRASITTPAVSPAANAPQPPSERGYWLLAITVATLGVAVMVAVLTGLLGGSAALVDPPPVLAVAATPAPAAGAGGGTIPASLSAQPGGSLAGSSGALQRHVPRRWMEGFYPIYSVAQETFAVNWLLIASIHRQESAFSTAPSTYHGLNFAGCCGGPMQFNVTNGPATTWSLVRDSYRYGPRPASYDHPTATHPSIYDDFDAIMAGAHLLSADGAGTALDGSAWNAAYDYYGHDAAGVAYADQVLARAIGWSQHGFCINCATEPALVEAVHAAYGAPVLAALSAADKHRHGAGQPAGAQAAKARAARRPATSPRSAG